MPLDDAADRKPAAPLADRRIPKGGDFLSPEALAQLNPAELTRRIKALQPLIAARAGEAERLRRPDDEVWAALRASGFFYQFVPKRFGGMETDFDSFIDAGMAIGEACASTAWVATFCAEHNWILTLFPLETQEKLWTGDFPYIIAPVVTAPPGNAEEAEGGWRVSGRWKWGTGVMHADWIGVNCLVQRDGKPPMPMMVMVPAEQATVLDTWHMDGMAGTGSNDIVLDNVFVPHAFTAPNISRSGRGPGRRDHENPIYGVPMLPFLAMSAAIPALGAVRGMVSDYRERLAAHVRLGSMTTQSDKPAAQIRLAKADMMARNAEVLVRDAGCRLLALVGMDEAEQLPLRLGVRAQIAHAVAICRDAATLLAEGAGSGVHALDHPFQRRLRDILVVSTHVVFDLDTAYELHGRGLVGLPPNSMLT